MGALRTNEKKPRNIDAASSFARVALGKVGGSCVYIEPKKTNTKLFDSDDVS